MSDTYSRGRDFIRLQGRILDRRLLATLFEGAPPDGVIDAVCAYRNEDGGFGHGIEPDVRCPASLPIGVEMAFQALAAAGAGDLAGGLVRQACEFLAASAAAAGAGGGVPPAGPVIEAYPRAAHWGEWTYAPGINPTAGLVGLLYELNCDHPWRAEAEAWCWRELDAGIPTGGAHTLTEALALLAHVPDRSRADSKSTEIMEALKSDGMFHLDPAGEGYGLTPLHVAPEPSSIWRSAFTDSTIEGHLDRLAAAQQPDGGWPISWEPPSDASVLEWRGAETLRALRVLTAYGRVSPGDASM